MSHEHSESVASIRVAHLRPIEKVEKTYDEKLGGVKKRFETN